MKQSAKTIAIRKELEQLSKLGGGVLNPEAVVEFARNKTTALHSQFEWDDGKASHEYRLWQARHLLSVQVRYEPRIERQMQVFVSLPADRNEEGGYRRMVDVLSHEGRREQLLASAIAEMEVFQRKYAAITELSELFVAMRRTLARVKKTKQRKSA